jgi:IclR family transcriptional regulator, KDG regulon repressor
LGAKFPQIAHAIEQQSDLRTVATPYLPDLQCTTGETGHAAVPVAHMMVYIDKVERSLPVRMASRIGQAAVLHGTAHGKAYLAALPQEAAQALLQRLALTRRTDARSSIGNPCSRSWNTIRQRGFALDDIEDEEGG